MRVSAPTRPPVSDGFDVIVIGGGINGIAIARQCAMAAQRVLLLEMNDFASGTTSRSTRIIHGGLRYLEHGEVGLVRESLRERDRLLAERPYLVRPTRFVLALPRNHGLLSLRGALAVRAGLGLYKWFAGPDRARRSGSDSLDHQLDLGKDFALFDYEDAQCEFPERLAAEWLVEAVHAGAVARNHTQVVQVRRSLEKLTVRFRDGLTGLESHASATVVINASGPWVDSVCATAFASSKKMIAGVRGSHILLDTSSEAPSSAIYSEAEDGRPFFILPWNQQILVGTTEVRDDSDPATATPTSDEIVYLIRAFNRIFPQRPISAADVRGTFSGIRPLPGNAHGDLSAISRRSIIHHHADDGLPGFYSIIGGKLTTAASLARECVQRIGIRVDAPPLPLVALGPAGGFDNTLAQWSRQAGRMCGISAEAARATAEWHGRCAFSILRRACAGDSLARPICEGTEHLLAEAVHAVQREFAVTLGDILLRRVPIALNGQWSTEQSAEAAQRIGHLLAWDARRIGEELEAFAEERRRLLGSAGQRVPASAEHAA